MAKLEVVIPVAGVGKRLRPHTYSMPKALIHVAGKPILGHILDEVESLRPSKVVLVVGHAASMIKEYVKKKRNSVYKFVHQPQPKGIGHAVSLAGQELSGGPLLIILGDTIFKTDLKRVISKRKNAIGVKPVSDPSRFGVVEVQGGRIRRVIEKPKRPTSNLAIVGIYYIEESCVLLEELDRLVSSGKSTKGEFQFTDGLAGMVKKGLRLGTFKVEGWYDCGTVKATLDANVSLLELSGGNRRRFKDSVVLKPSYVDRSATILRSVIGPHTTVAKGAVIIDSAVRSSIVEAGARIENTILERSLVGRAARIEGKAASVNASELSELSYL